MTPPNKPETYEADRAFIAAALTGGTALPDQVVSELADAVRVRPDGDPSLLLGWVQRRLFARGAREDVAALLSEVRKARAKS